jgi:polyisoprenoid-binding protein YceI
MKKIVFVICVAICALIVSQAAYAQVPKWELDKDHSNFYFDVKHIYSTVRGHFEDYSGAVYFDPDNLAQSRCEIEVAVKSVNTQNRKRDNHLRSEDFFDVGKFPTMKFASTAVKHIKDNEYLVEGKLTIKDVTKTLSVPFVYFGTKPSPFDDKQLVAGFETRFVIDRLDYHVGSGKYYEMGVTGKDIDITVTMEVIRNK